MKNQQQGNKYDIDHIFTIFDEKHLIVHLLGIKWTSKGERKVTLVCREKSFSCIYKGYSIMNNKVAVKLVPQSKDEKEVQKLFDFFREKHTPRYLLLEDDI